MSRRTLIFSAGVLSGILLETLPVKPLFAHGGHITEDNVFWTWNREPTVPLITLLAAYLYLKGLKRWRHPLHPVKPWQRASFFLGLLVAFLALQSPIDALGDKLFWGHQVQHFLLRMVAPPLILLGAPLTPLLRGMPRWALQGVVRPLVRNSTARRVYRFLTHPLTASLLFVGMLYFWQIPGPHNLSVRSDLVDYIMHLSMVVSALLLWWRIIEFRPSRRRLHYGLRMLLLAMVTVPTIMLGAFISSGRRVIYTAYDEVGRLWGIPSLTDEQIGGLILWVPSSMMCAMAMVILAYVWLQGEWKKQTTIEVPTST